MSQSDCIKFLCENKIDVTNMSYNLLNDIMAVAKRMAEKEFKEILLVLCEAQMKGGVE